MHVFSNNWGSRVINVFLIESKRLEYHFRLLVDVAGRKWRHHSIFGSSFHRDCQPMLCAFYNRSIVIRVLFWLRFSAGGSVFGVLWFPECCFVSFWLDKSSFLSKSATFDFIYACFCLRSFSCGISTIDKNLNIHELISVGASSYSSRQVVETFRNRIYWSSFV